MNIAIIGSGIAGLTCAATGRTPSGNAVRSGRHAGRPHRHRGCRHAAGHRAIDTGFIVYNDRTYPRFMGLLSELGIAGQKTQMSFSVHNPASGLEYNGHSLTSLFAQRRNLLKPAFWGLLSEIVRFNRLAKLALTEALDRARRWRASSPATASAPSSPATIFCRWGRPSGRRRCRRCAASRCRCFALL